MKKKVLSMFFAMTMVFGLMTGCGSEKEAANSVTANNETTGKESTSEATETGSGSQTESTESVIDFTEDPYVVDIQFTGLFEENNDLAAVEEAINAITLPQINCKVHIVPGFIGELPNETSLAIAGGEKIDIVTVGLTQSISSMVPDGLLLGLDDLIAQRGANVAAATADVAEAQKINGVTYGISGYTYPAMSAGFVYNKTMADKYGIDMHDKMTMDELKTAGETLKENGVYLTSFGNSSQLNYKFFKLADIYGGSGEYGVVLNPSESTTIENIFASESFADYCKVIKDWNDSGFLPADQLTDTTTVQEYFSQQKIFGTSTAYTVNQIASWLTPDFETGIIQLDDAGINTSSVTEYMLGIASTCERPDKAMDFINLLYGNADVANLLQYGIEGTDYVAVEGTENVITFDGTSNEDHNGYYSPFVHFGDPMNLKIVTPLTDSYYDDLKTFNDSAKKSLAFGYSFDGADYSAETGAISSVLTEKMPMLNAGQIADADAAIAELVSALEAAGINDVIAANQKQLDAYLAQ